MSTVEPLIYTTLGNVPVSTLKCEREWTYNDDGAKFVERYRDSDGIVVREDCHVYTKQGLASSGELSQG